MLNSGSLHPLSAVIASSNITRRHDCFSVLRLMNDRRVNVLRFTPPSPSHGLLYSLVTLVDYVELRHRSWEWREKENIFKRSLTTLHLSITSLVKALHLQSQSISLGSTQRMLIWCCSCTARELCNLVLAFKRNMINEWLPNLVSPAITYVLLRHCNIIFHWNLFTATWRPDVELCLLQSTKRSHSPSLILLEGTTASVSSDWWMTAGSMYCASRLHRCHTVCSTR